MAKSYSSSAILKHLKAGTECACLAVFETCRNEWGSKAYFCHGSKHSKGVAILFNPRLKVLVEDEICCENGRILILQFSIMITRKLYFLNNSDLYLNSFPATTL